MSMKFSPENEKKFEEILKGYPRKDAAMLPVLWLAQEEFGILTEEVLEFIAKKLDVSKARVESVVSFYTMYKTKKQGKFHIQVCRNLPCVLRGAERIMEAVEAELKIKPGETTPDELFTYSHVECLAACGTAPAMQIEKDYHENLTSEGVLEIIKTLRQNGS